MINSFYNPEEIEEIGFKSVGKHVLISKYAHFYGVENIKIGDYVRIDDFSILSGNITIGSHVHISAYSALYGQLGIIMEDYTGLSPRCILFSAMDDFSGDYMIGPMVDKSKTNITGGVIYIKKYSQIGAGSIVFPNIVIEEGVIVGAMSLVRQDLDNWSIYAGIPAKKIKKRGKKILLRVDE